MLIKPRNIDENLDSIKEMKPLGKRYIVMRENHNRIIFTLENNRMVSFCVEKLSGVQVGDIVVGKVKNVVKNIQGAFINIDKDTTCFMSLEDCKNPILLNRNYDGRICESDEIIVQIKKEAYKNKLPSVSAKLELVSDAMVISYDGNDSRVTFSKKISSNRKEELRLMTAKVLFPGYSVLLRTEAEEWEPEDLMQTLKSENEKMVALIEKGRHLRPYHVLHKKGYILDSLLWQSRKEADALWITEDLECYEYLTDLAGKMEISKDKIRLYQDESLPLAILYGLKTKLDEITKEKVWLKNGGYLYITPTEAMTVIDVNSGKFQSKDKKEEALLQVNKEASTEIAYQIRARNLSGIIIVDFINLKDEKHRTILLHTLQKTLEGISPKGTVIDITKLGLIEIVRKKERADIYEFKDLLYKTILM